MNFSRDEQKILKSILIALGFMIALLPAIALAKGGKDDGNRSEFYGIVQKRPESGLPGEWVIGNRVFIAAEGTEFDQSEGELTVGSCVKVHLRNGRVHEIDSEPMRDCQ